MWNHERKETKLSTDFKADTDAITNNTKIHSPEETQKTHIGYNKEWNRLQNEYGISKTTLHYVKKKTKLNKRKLYSV